MVRKHDNVSADINDPFTEEPFFRIFQLNHESLSASAHRMRFLINDEFFSYLPFSPIKHANVLVKVEAEKQKTNIMLKIKMEGWVEVPCDRCSENFKYPVEFERRLLIKLTDKVSAIERDEELMLVPHWMHTIPLARDFYDLIILSLPMKIVHPEGECNPETLRILSRYSAREEAEGDPRWEALSSLIKDDS